MLATVMMVFGAMPGLAGERTSDDRVAQDAPVADVSDRPVVRPSEARSDASSDRPADIAPVDIADPPADRSQPSDRVTDRPVDREVDRRCVDFITDRSCIDDRHPHVNLRHLIQRLINAGEWEKLFRLLHRLGII
jgi:hypothetical protein